MELKPCPGLIPQAPLHTASLVVLGYEKDSEASSETAVSGTEFDRVQHQSPAVYDDAVQLSDMEEARGDMHRTQSGKAQKLAKRRLSMKQKLEQRRIMMEANAQKREVPVAVVEQRVSNLAQGCLCELQWSS